MIEFFILIKTVYLFQQFFSYINKEKRKKPIIHKIL